MELDNVNGALNGVPKLLVVVINVLDNLKIVLDSAKMVLALLSTRLAALKTCLSH